jgi:hypothetical protein
MYYDKNNIRKLQISQDFEKNSEKSAPNVPMLFLQIYELSNH